MLADEHGTSGGNLASLQGRMMNVSNVLIFFIAVLQNIT